MEHYRSSSFSGWYDPIIQNKAYVDFATNAPGYGQLQSDDVIKKLNEDLPKCTALEEACYAAGYAAGNNAKSDKICKAADDYCVRFPLKHLVAAKKTDPWPF